MSRVTPRVRAFAVAVAAAAAATGLAAADTRQARAPTPSDAHALDGRSWTLLGTRTVDGRADRDTITVGRYPGRFDELILVVEDADLALRELVVVFATGERFAPSVNHVFAAGQRSRTIELPGRDRQIAAIELSYGNLRANERAAIAIYGRDRAATPARVAGPPGWTLLAAQNLDGEQARRAIPVGAYHGRFDQLMLVVADSPLVLDALFVELGTGERFAPALDRVFDPGERSPAIDLPGKNRQVASIEIAYRNAPDGIARIQLYGLPGDPAPRRAGPPVFDASEWTFLGTHTIEKRRERDTIRVARHAGKLDELTIVATEADLALYDVTVVLDRGRRWKPRIPRVMRANTRTHAIDLPGKRPAVRAIELVYGRRGAGTARVEVYGRAR